MANYGTTTTHRPSTNPPPPPPSQINDESKPKKLYTITFSFPFDIPSSPESAAVRIVKNLHRFHLYYATFIWTVLFIALVPKRKVSIVYLVATTDVAFISSLLLRALPHSLIPHRIIGKQIAFLVVFVVIAFEMIMTKAAIHLFLVLDATVPIVILLAALTKIDVVVAADDEEAEELKRGGGAQSEDLV